MLTEERRRGSYVRVIKHMAEDGRIVVRNIRRDARKHMEGSEKAGEIRPKRELERAEKELEKITHDHVELIDKRVSTKSRNCSRCQPQRRPGAGTAMLSGEGAREAP